MSYLIVNELILYLYGCWPLVSLYYPTIKLITFASLRVFGRGSSCVKAPSVEGIWVNGPRPEEPLGITR